MNAHGHCLCGAVDFTANSPAYTAHECHCSQCRRWSGHVWAYVQLRWNDLGFARDDGLAWYSHTPKARRGFCAHCGTTLFWRRSGSDKVDVSAGVFDTPTGLRLGAPSYPENRGDYY